jgi:hypothetical protein
MRAFFNAACRLEAFSREVDPARVRKMRKNKESDYFSDSQETLK